MADPSPDDTGEGKKPEAGEGQEPEEGEVVAEAQEGAAEKTYSQSYVKQLRKENAERREREAELQTKLAAIEDAEKTELQRLTEQVEVEKAARKDAELKQLRVEVAGEAGLDLGAVQFLTGTTREEIEHRAEELAKLLKQGKPAAGFDGGARQKTPPEKKKPEEEHNALLLRAMGRTPQS